MTAEYEFHFGAAKTRLNLRETLPGLEQITASPPPSALLLVCDPNTAPLARRIMGGAEIPLCILPGGEAEKNWAAVERILKSACDAALGRDSLFIGIGGGVVTDLTAFAASAYMRGTGLALVPTTLLGMVDAALGGKAGFDLFGIKNLAGSFYPASQVVISLEALATLPAAEWKSGMAELIKTAILDETGEMFTLLESLAGECTRNPGGLLSQNREALFRLVSRAVEIKGRIVEADPRETGTDRALLNLGHTFGHALEAAAGLGSLSHGEAVAWGMVRACELGEALSRTPTNRGRAIRNLIAAYGYETRSPHPLGNDTAAFFRALSGDKKRRAGTVRFVVPDANRAQLVSLDIQDSQLRAIIDGDFVFNDAEAPKDGKN
ncbi:3-dehydroquinate synthase [Spirochaetia bacterium]|nr:3-dehydroquinate synthase [Spirochaetia bacterium]